MKKYLFALLFFLIFSFPSFAQEKTQIDFQRYWYAGMNGGYGFSALPELIGTSQNYNSVNVIYSGTFGSFGKGANAEIYGGYMINRNLGIEIGFSDLLGTIFTNKSTYLPPAFYQEQFVSSMMRIHSGIRMTYGKNKFKPYTRMAFVLGIFPKVYYKSDGVDNAGLPSDYWMTYSGGYAFGFNGGAGINYDNGRKISYFIEAVFFFQNWAPSKSLVTKNIEKGVDEYWSMNIAQKAINYYKSYDSSLTYDPNSPNKQIKFYYPFSSWGFNIGIHYKFEKDTPRGKPGIDF